MADNKKIITDELLKLQTEKILQVIADSTYDWQEYTDSEISDILEITDEQAMQLTKILNDQVVANNKLWSSSKTDAEIKNALIESNKYTDDLVANLSNIKLDIVDSLPDSSTVNKSTIYILKDSSGGTNNTLNVWSDTTSAFVEVGKLNVNMDNYYTKSEVDAELAKKANADEVLKPDAIVADLTTTSGTTVLSSAGLQTELDKKVGKSAILSAVSATPSDENTLSEKAVKTELDKKIDKTSIATSIDSSSTDTQVASAKCINDNYGIKTYTTLEQIGLTKGSETLIGIATNLPDDSILTLTITTEYNITEYPYKYGILVVQKLNNYRVGFTFFQDNGTVEWINYYNAGGSDVKGWARLCGTSVADVAQTTITPLHSNVTSGSVYYQVKNGICYVSLIALSIDKVESFTICEGLPRCSSKPHCVLTNGNGNTILGLVYVSVSGGLGINMRQSGTGYCEFSYPVAES